MENVILTTKKVKEIKSIIDFDLRVDVCACYPDSWNVDFERFCNFLERQKLSEKTIKDNWIPDSEMDKIFGDEWSEKNRACEIFENVFWGRLFDFNKRAFNNPIWFPDSAVLNLSA